MTAYLSSSPIRLYGYIMNCCFLRFNLRSGVARDIIFVLARWPGYFYALHEKR